MPARLAACQGPARAASVRFHDDGRRALVGFSDGSLSDLDLTDPAAPTVALTTPSAGDTSPAETVSAAALPIGNRTLALVSAAGVDELACPEVPAGLRVVALTPQLPADVATIRYPTEVSPGALVASGEQAFVAWHTDGLRVIDLGLVAPRTVAQFVPVNPDVIGVALLASYVVAVDRSSGLYVLDRPEEGHPESFWTKLKNAAGADILCWSTARRRCVTTRHGGMVCQRAAGLVARSAVPVRSSGERSFRRR